MITLAAATAQALPVIVRSMPPEVVRKLPHVFVSNWPRPDALAWWTLDAAIAAAVIGLFTLAAVGWQIWLARDELTAVKDDFALAQKQFDLAQQQFKLAMRSPNLVAKVWLGNEVRQVAADRAVYREAHLRVQALNEGTKVSRGAVGDLFIPYGVLFRYENTNHVDINDTSYVVMPILYGTLGRRVYPAKPIGGGGTFNFKPEISEVKVLWRFDDEEYCYPEEGYGEVTLVFNLLM